MEVIILCKFIEYLKESWQWILAFVIGCFMIGVPDLAEIFNWSIFNIEKLKEFNLIRIFGWAFVFIAFIMLCYHFLYLRRFCIIKVDGMKNDELRNQKSYNLFDIAKQDFDNYHVYIEDETNKQSIYKAYCEMSGMFKANKAKGLYDKYLFYGYTYTPFIFMLGQMYSDNKEYYCFHMRQENQSTKRVRLKRKSKDDNSLVDSYYENNNDSLVIRIGTTISVDKMNISQFGETDVFDITSKRNGTEVIDSLKRLNEWCNIIVEKIRNLNLTKYSSVSLLLSTSSEMVFLLGKRLSKNSDVNYYVYHYDANSKNIYPWSLASKKNGYDNIVCFFENIKDK